MCGKYGSDFPDAKDTIDKSTLLLAIANELAEANRLKRWELELLNDAHEVWSQTFLKEELKDKAWIDVIKFPKEGMKLNETVF